MATHKTHAHKSDFELFHVSEFNILAVFSFKKTQLTPPTRNSNSKRQNNAKIVLRF